MRAHAGEGIDLISMWEGADAVVLIDAVRSGAPAGTMHRFDVSEVSPPSPLRAKRATRSTLPPRSNWRGRSAGSPPKVIIYGVEGEDFETGSAPSAAVRAATGPLAAADAVRAEARALLSGPPRGNTAG